MKTAQVLSWMLAAIATASAKHPKYNESIVVNVAPDFLRPTANSSDGTFSLVQHNGKDSGWTSARPHTHRLTHEHFYCARGRVELWGQKNATNATDEARLTDPDTQLTHIFHPGGFEYLFDVFSLGEFETSAISSPYIVIPADAQPSGPLTPELDVLFAGLDLYAAPEEALKWHNGANTLPNDPTEPYFVAKDYGPKYLNSDNGYKVIRPLATPEQATGGTIIMSPKLPNQSSSNATLPHHFALQMEDGQLVLSVNGYDSVSLLQGDVTFIPSGIPFTYHSTVPFTKFMYMNARAEGLDNQLLKKSVNWDFPAYPNA
ncbi:Quercetin 2,3-dioxygenase [Tolypocladium ophioglossoides CBS 100239]|uniref:Quercetin 2,3-dioxygenase n=1 Tax=Tolypocladium ophioglossoides (strain CBS 100239) TaxID=1163406 RepID=A0A0L0MZ12_TOLOC|nr:Quercetin 2,3-dioxygenase [Tolypocladium ophioglossoides CBS 100239]